MLQRLISPCSALDGTTAIGAVGSPGALQVAGESGPLADSTIDYAYDELGRVNSRTVEGAGAEIFGYDSLGRLTSHDSDLGAFALAYLGQTDQITSRALASSTLATTWSYLPNSGDRRLSEISNVGLSAGQYSTYAFTTTPENFITGITEASDTSAVYPWALSQTASYNTLNQLTDLSGQTLTWDADGNLTSDGTRTYTWDAENRLVGVAYPGEPGKATSFAYDGLGRRVAITSTPAGGGSSVTTSYLWCGSVLCQARDAGNATTREYLAEGEYVPGVTPETDYYGIDQIGTVRRVFASTSSAAAFRYDPYGVPLQVTAPTTDFAYAGMFQNADSGLDLTLYRAYDRVAGRWLSRDPSGELLPYAARTSVGGAPNSGSQTEWTPDFAKVDTGRLSGIIDRSLPPGSLYHNLYLYAVSNPINLVDPSGLAPGDKRFGLPDAFWRWYHRQLKEPGDPDLSFEEAQECFEEWKSLGSPGPESPGSE